MYNRDKRLLYVLSGLLIAAIIAETVVLGLLVAHVTGAYLGALFDPWH